ncbi:MAG: lipid A biosynthesis lauroyl acyltransferase [Pseudomonadota bacterium]
MKRKTGKKRLIRHPLIERQLLRLKTAWDWIVAKQVGLLIHFAKKLPAARSTELFGSIAYQLAPILPRTKLAKRNLRAAFPEKSTKEINTLAREVWRNVGQAIAEYVFLDELFDYDVNNPDAGRIEVRGVEQFKAILDKEKPVIIFTGHTGNWEILPVAASTYGLEVTALFRPPNNRFLAKRVLKARTTSKGHLVPSRAGAAWSLANVLDGGQTVGLLADQALTRGVPIEFFGRKATGNPLAARLAKQFECDIHPARCIRLPGGRYRLELLPALDLPKDDKGRLDVEETTQMINSVIEGWVREYPAQWLWLHDRWKLKPVRVRKMHEKQRKQKA